MQRLPYRLQQFPLRRAARPSAPKLVFFLVHIFEADGFHLGHAPLFGFSLRGRSRHARANVIAQLGEVLEGMRIHHPFACNLNERRLCSVLIRPFWRRPIVCPRRPRSAQRKSHCHHRRFCQNTSHPHSPYVLWRRKTLPRCQTLPLPIRFGRPFHSCCSCNSVTSSALPSPALPLHCLRGLLEASLHCPHL